MIIVVNVIIALYETLRGANMQRKLEIWTPKNSIVIARIIGLFLLLILWIRGDGSEVGIALLLFLMIMSLIRWRLIIPNWVILIDQLACMIAIPLWKEASYCLIIPLFEAMTIGKSLLSLPSLIYIITFNILSFPLIISFILAGFIGKIINGWLNDTRIYRQDLDKQRHDRYELEELKGELLIANSQVARMAELSERNRIAQELHDNVGHELTAALLALQAFEQLWIEEDPLASDMFQQTKERLNNSATQLRETVHNMKPLEVMGINRFKDICNGYSNLKVDFSIFGDSSTVPVHLWSILEPCLKEALTNVSRHSQGTKVVVTMDINPHIVRLSVVDNGVGSKSDSVGIGIRNLRQRAQSVGGNISTKSSNNGFHLICVLPMDREEITK